VRGRGSLPELECGFDFQASLPQLFFQFNKETYYGLLWILDDSGA
jgi:hypothetical protein